MPSLMLWYVITVCYYGPRMVALTRIGLVCLAVMGQNLALNIAKNGFTISMYNETTSKVEEIVERAKQEGNLPLYDFHEPESLGGG